MRGSVLCAIAAVLTVAAVYVSWHGTAAIWDGSHQLIATLVDQRPFLYEGRFHSYLIWLPVVWTDRLTDDLTVLTAVFGLPVTLAPVVGLLASFWVVRRRAPHLVLWALFGTLAAPLPGQIFLTNDSIFQQHLFWPVLLGMLAPGRPTRPQVAVLAVFSLFQLSHPIGIPLMLGAAAAALLLSFVDGPDRRRLRIAAGLAALLGVLAVAKLLRLGDSYAATEATWEMARVRFRQGVAGWPIRGLFLMALAGVLLLVHAHARDRDRGRGRWALALGLACVAGAGACWIYWAAAPERWRAAIDYRRWLVPLTAPFFVLAFADAALRARSRTLHDRGAPDVAPSAGPAAAAAATGIALAAVFATVLVLQTNQWARLCDRLMAEVRAYPGCAVPFTHLAWVEETPLGHWSLNSYVILAQGKQPQKLVLDEDGVERALADPPRITFCWFVMAPATPGRGGWFDFGPFLTALREEKASKARDR